MEKVAKIILPSPNFEKVDKTSTSKGLHLLTPSGMTLLPRAKQPVPVLGKHDPRKYTSHYTPGKQVPSNSQQQEVQFCEACEMELKSEEDMRRHRAQHERCPVEGCSYRGHPKVMDKHVTTLHNTGLFDKYKKLSTPEEIAAWREERKKRYPTVANVEMHQKAKEQRQKRGERLEENKSRFGKREDRLRIQKGAVAEQKKARDVEQNGESQNKNVKNIRRNNRRKKEKLVKPPASAKIEKISRATIKPPTQEAEVKLNVMPMFKGTSQLENYKHLKAKNCIKENNALSSFLGMYGSEDDDTDDVNSNTEDDEKDARDHHVSDDLAEAGNDSITSQRGQRTTSTEKSSSDDKVSNKILTENTSKEEERESMDTRNQMADCNSEKILNDKALYNDKLTISNEKEGIHSYTKQSDGLTNAKNGIVDNSVKQKSDSSDEAPEEAAIEKSSHIPDLPTKKEPPRKRVKVDDAKREGSRSQRSFTYSGLDYRKARLRKQNTMLEKLLESDIRHERNVLLQCVRFVCENNFFGVGQITKEKSEKESE